MVTQHFKFAAFALAFSLLWFATGFAQDETEKASVHSSVAADGTGTITVEARGHLPEPPVFFRATSSADVNVMTDLIEQLVRIDIDVIQGKAKTLSLGLHGAGDVTEVQCENLKSWSVRQVNKERFLDLHVNEGTTNVKAVLKLRTQEIVLPSTVDLMHLSSGDAISFDSIVTIAYAPEVEGRVTVASGFVPLERGR